MHRIYKGRPIRFDFIAFVCTNTSVASVCLHSNAPDYGEMYRKLSDTNRTFMFTGT